MYNTAHAQQLLKNGSFNDTTANWTTGCFNVEAYFFETTYGGLSGTNRVAEVDDSSCFYQDVCVLPGKDYIFSMRASRRTGTAPNPLTCNIKIEGLDAANTVAGAPLVDMDFSRTNAVFNLIPVLWIPVVNVSLASGIVRLRIKLTDNTPGFSTYGMVVDNLGLTYVTPPKIVSVDTVCQNRLHTLSIADLPSSGITYDWDFGAGATPATSTTAAPSVSWSTPGLKTVRCLLGNGSCTADTLYRNIYVAPLPAAPAVTSPVHYCVGDAATALTATGTNLLWYTTVSGGTGSSAAPVPSTAATGSITYYVSQSAGSCESDRAAITVVVNNTIAGFTPEIHYGCNRDSVRFRNTSINALNYAWDFGDGSTSSLSDPTHTFTSGKIHTVTLVSTNGTCSDTARLALSLPGVIFAPSFTTSSDTVCTLREIQFTNTSVIQSSENTVPVYLWTFGDGDLSRDAAPAHAYQRPGIYRVNMTVTLPNRCSGSVTKDVTVFPCCKVDVPSAFSPNGDGRNDQFRLLHVGDMKVLEYNIYNRYGQVVFTGRHADDAWDGTFKGTPLDMGTYFYVVQVECGYNGPDIVTFRGDINLIR